MRKRFKIRPYQARGIAAIIKLTEGPSGAWVFVAPTGSGKTVIAGDAIKQLLAAGKRVMFLAHIVTIVQQTYKQLIDECGLDPSQVGVMMAGDEILEGGKGRIRPDAPVQICGVQTLASMRRRGVKMPHFDVIFIDECHHAAAESYAALIALYPNAWIFGLTATPMRSDGKGLRAYFSELHVIATPGELMAHKPVPWLARPSVWLVPKGKARKLISARLAKVKSQHGDFQQALLEHAMNVHVLVGRIVSEWKRLGKGRQTVVFCCGIAHSKAVAARFRRAGVKAIHIDGDDPKQAAAARKWLNSGEITVICNYGVLAEGWDQPSVKCLVQARPTKSLTVHLQQTGRCLRPYRGLRPIILDHAGNHERHGMVDDPRVYTLDGIVSKGDGECPVKTCGNPKCGVTVSAGHKHCPECGFKFPMRKRTPEEVAARLELVRRNAWRKRLEKLANEIGADETWVKKVAS